MIPQNLTLSQIKELTKQFKRNNPNVKTSEELLEELNNIGG